MSMDRDEKLPISDSETIDIRPHQHQKSPKLRRILCYVGIAALIIAIVLCLLLAIVWSTTCHRQHECKDDGNCWISLVESIPENLTYPVGSPLHPSIYDAWMRLIGSATKSIDIAAFYWTLSSSDVNFDDPSDWQGKNVLQGLISAARDRKIKLRIVNNFAKVTSNDTVDLINAGAEVRSINFAELLKSGVLHTKLWIVDGLHAYVGSANMDYRSLTQVKELGAVVENCSCVTADVAKIFSVYWYLGVPHTPIPPDWPVDWYLGVPHTPIPPDWPVEYKTSFNKETPMKVLLNATESLLYLSSSPPPFCPDGRTSDIDAILDVIGKAKEFIHIAVMDYIPSMLYVRHKRFWPVIDDALRKASLERGVRVRLLASRWNHTKHDMIYFLRSLSDVSGAMKADIQVKLFEVPAFTPLQAKIPFGRVNHNKYMVTDNVAYIGTSNWSEDYFVSTAGVGLVINQTHSDCRSGESFSQDDNGVTPSPCKQTMQSQLAAVFDRDWNSTYAHPLPK